MGGGYFMGGDEMVGGDGWGGGDGAVVPLSPITYSFP